MECARTALSRLRSSQPAPGLSGSQHGHTLIELLIALTIIGICAVLPAVTLTRHLERVERRSVSLVFQQVVALGQAKAMYAGVPIDVACDGSTVVASGPLTDSAAAPMPGIKATVSSNILRWSRSTGVSVRFGPGFGSPDGAGSVYVGSLPGQMRVVVRVESGLTRLEVR